MSLATLAGVLLQGAFWLVIGYAFARPWLFRAGRPIADSSGAREVSIADAVVAAVVGFVAFACVLMATHIALGGFVFGMAAPVPIAVVGALVIGRRSRRRNRLEIRSAVTPLAWIVLGIVFAALFVAPVIAGGSSIRTGDPPWHLGWTEQVLAGERLPTGPAPADVARNAYPWGLHATLATLVRATPGSNPLLAYETLHLIVVFGIPMAAACLAERVRRDAGIWAAGAAGLIGGFGWLFARRPAFATSPSGGAFGADMVVASPNSAYELFPPGLPRELGLVVLGAFAAFAVSAHARGRNDDAIRAGAVAGICGLVSVPLFLSALMWAGALAWASRRSVRRGLATVAVAGAVFAAWAAPVALQYARHGGFVDITPRLGKEWPLAVALASWGLLLPAAGLGAVLIARERRAAPGGRSSLQEVPGRGLVAIAAACAILLVLAIARGAASWDLAGNATLLHQGRVWPPAHLAAAALAGIGLAAAAEAAGSRVRRIALAVVIAAGGLPSLVLSSAYLSDVLREGGAGYVYGGAGWAPGSFATRAAELLGPDDLVEVNGSHPLAFALFQLSGVRLASFDDPRLPDNDLRVRYAELAEAWDARAGDFSPTHVVVRVEDLEEVGGALVLGRWEGDEWALLEAPPGGR